MPICGRIAVEPPCDQRPVENADVKRAVHFAITCVCQRLQTPKNKPHALSQLIQPSRTSFAFKKCGQGVVMTAIKALTFLCYNLRIPPHTMTPRSESRPLLSRLSCGKGKSVWQSLRLRLNVRKLLSTVAHSNTRDYDLCACSYTII